MKSDISYSHTENVVQIEIFLFFDFFDLVQSKNIYFIERKKFQSSLAYKKTSLIMQEAELPLWSSKPKKEIPEVKKFYILRQYFHC